MSRVSRSRVKEIFSEAAALESSQRDIYLDGACGGDAALRAEVERLLAASDDTGDILNDLRVTELLSPPPERVHTLAPGDLVGRFRIVNLLGRGGMGEVYEAEDGQFGGRVALKTLRSEFVSRHSFKARFRREIRLARKVTHPNVCRILDVGTHTVAGEEIAYLTMELLAGETLFQRLSRGCLPHADAIAVFRQVALGLQALHEASVVHRDLKPGNVILVQAASGVRCVITDFGLAHNAELAAVAAGSAETVTAAGQMWGTPAYMAPEQLMREPVGAASDIYSLGVVMYEALSGRCPFDAQHFVSSAAQKLAGPPKPPGRMAALDWRWDGLILRCLSVAAPQRPTAAEVIGLLHALEKPQRQPRLVDRLRRRWTVHQWAVLCSLALVVIAAAVLLQARSVREPVFRRLCEAWPGQRLFCALPADKDIAVFPFVVKGASEADRALGAGCARYLRESFHRLAPEPEKMCVHLRDDELADAMQLVLEGEVEVARDELMIHASVRESRPQRGRSSPLTLRRMRIRVPRSEATALHTSALMEIGSALELTYAARDWDGWIASGPRFSESFLAYLEGLGRLHAGQYEEAANAFNSAIDPARDFAFAPAHVGLGDAYRLLYNKTGDQAWELPARQAYARAVSFDEPYGFAGARKRRGELEAGLASSKAAIADLEAALRLWPYDHSVVKSLASAHEASRQLEAAETVMRDAISRAPNCWLTHNTLANYYQRHTRFGDSEKSLLEAIRIAPDNAGVYHNLALLYLRTGRFDDAIDMASRSIHISALPMTYSNLGRALFYRGCHEDGLLNLRKAVELQPDFYIPWANLAETLFSVNPGAMEAVEAAQRTVELATQVLERNPSAAYARAERAVYLAWLGEKRRAAEEARQALEMSPGSHDVVLKAAEAMDIAGERRRALAELEAAAKAGLSIHELNAAHGLSRLRADLRFRDLLGRVAPHGSADPGGLTPPGRTACPASSLPGQGMRKLD
jgi:tetratricopeptide (TPR) repeat protein